MISASRVFGVGVHRSTLISPIWMMGQWPWKRLLALDMCASVVVLVGGMYAPIIACISSVAGDKKAADNIRSMFLL
jgi:hypothetical protein